MEWLKEILEQAEMTEDGKLNVDAVMKTVNAEFPKHAVPKNDYNDKVNELKTANATIKDLKQSTVNNQDLQDKITGYEEKIKNLQKTASDTAKGYALKEQLSKSGVLDPDYIIYKTGGLDKFNFDKDNNPIGVDDVIKSYKEDKTMTHLFKQDSKYNPSNGGNGGLKNPFAKETFNMTEQGKLFKNNPEQARELASAAGVEI